MTAGLIPNLGFETELAGRAVPAVVRRQEKRFAWILRLVPGFSDAVPYEEGHDRVVVWGRSEAVRQRVGDLAEDWPSPEVVRWANDKRTSHDIERQLGVDLPGSSRVADVGELETAIAAIDGPWVAKDPWGVAGRGQVVCDFGRASRMVSDVGEVVIEPWCSEVRDFSIHLDVTATGVDYVGSTTLLTDASGTFRGNSVPGRVPAGAIDVAMQTGEALRSRGWRGPAGIDGFEALHCGTSLLRPLCEINARWTFGRLTIELARELRVNRLSWHHPAHSSTDLPTSAAHVDCGSGDFRLPTVLDPAARSGTYLTIEPNQGIVLNG